MLTELQIENFKAFKKPQTVPLRPITLLLGPNSAGKSSIIHAFLLLKQTLDEAESPEPAFLAKGRWVDLGNFSEFVHGHDPEARVRIGLRLDEEEAKRTPHRRYRGTDAGLSDPWIRVGLGLDKAKLGAVVELEIGDGGWDDRLASFRPAAKRKAMGARPRRPRWRGGFFRQPMFRLSSIDRTHDSVQAAWAKFSAKLPKLAEKRQAELESARETLQLFEQDDSKGFSELREEFRRMRSQEMTDSVERLEAQLSRLEDYTFDAYFDDLTDLARTQQLYVRNWLPTGVRSKQSANKSNVLIEPASGPRQRYSRAARRESSPFAELIAQLGDDIGSLITDAIYLGPLRERPERYRVFSGNVTSRVGQAGQYMPDLLYVNRRLQTSVNKWFDRFGLRYRLKTLKRRGDDVFAIRLVDNDTHVDVSDVDVGFGISQMMPIIVQGLVAENQMVIVEQPEIHVHPKMQAEIGEFMAEMATTRSNRFLVETHSEHLVLRLQKLVRQRRIEPEMISIVYVEATSGGARLSKIRLDEGGDFIDEWPEGFFPERLGELGL